MKLYFQDRESYRKKIIPLEIETENAIIIPEGGFSTVGVMGLESLIYFKKNKFNARVFSRTYIV